MTGSGMELGFAAQGTLSPRAVERGFLSRILKAAVGRPDPQSPLPHGNRLSTWDRPRCNG
ncbi:MAG: hypothetical protein Fur0037_12220 [Planctomycetota bacterium]